MSTEKKDFKAVKVAVKKEQKTEQTVSQGMIYSGVNIFGHLTQQYLANRETIEASVYTSGNSKSKQESVASSGSSDFLNLQTEELMIFKKLQKKDSVTRCKAFKQLSELLASYQKNQEQNENLTNVITFFLYYYQKIMIYESDRQVREAAQNSFANLVALGPKHLKGYLDKIFPVWFSTFFDSSPEVVRQGRLSFSQAFPEREHLVFKKSFKYFLHFADETLSVSEQVMFEDYLQDIPSKGQKEETYDRIISQVLMALAESFQIAEKWQDQEEHAYFLKKMISYLRIEQINNKDKKEKKQQNLFDLLTKKSRGRVRSACLIFTCRFLTAVSEELAQSFLSELIPLIFDMAQEDNSVVQNCLWKEAYFELVKRFPTQIWQHINLKKNFVPAIFNCLKNAGFGASHSLYQNLIKVVSIFPLFKYTDDELQGTQNKYPLKDKANFLSQFFQSIYSARKNEEAANYHQDLTSSYFETLAFIIFKRVEPYLEKKGIKQGTFLQGEMDADVTVLWSQLKLVIEQPIQDYLKRYEKVKNQFANQRNIRVTIPTRYLELLKTLVERNVRQDLINAVKDIIFQNVFESFNEQNSLRFLKPMLVFQDSEDDKQQKSIDFVAKFLEELSQALFKKQLADIDQLKPAVVQDVAVLISNFQQLMRRNSKLIIKLSEITNLIVNIETTLKRAKAVMSAQNMEQLRTILNQITLMGIIQLHRIQIDKEQVELFIKTTLINSETLTIEAKCFILLPIINIANFKFKPIQNQNVYFANLRNSASNFIEQFTLENLMKNDEKISQYKAIKSLLQNALAQETEKSVFSLFPKGLDSPKIFLKWFLDQWETSKNIEWKLRVLLSVEDFLTSSNLQIVEEFHHKLLDLLTADEEDQAQTQLWQLFQNLINQRFQVDNKFGDLVLKAFKKRVNKALQTGKITERIFEGLSKIEECAMILRKYFILLPANDLANQMKEKTLKEIVLDQLNFENNSLLALSLFKSTCLTGGLGGFDISQYLGNKENSWLAYILLNLDTIPLLNKFPDLKRQLTIFSNTEVQMAVLSQLQPRQDEKIGSNNTTLLFDLLNRWKKDIFVEKQEISAEIQLKTTCAIQAIGRILQLIVQQSEGGSPLLSVEQFKKIFDLLCSQTIQKLLGDSNEQEVLLSISIDEMSLLTRTLDSVAYYVLDDERVTKIIKRAKKNLHIDILTNDLIWAGKAESQIEQKTALLKIVFNMQIYLSLFKQFYNTENDPELQEYVVQWIIGNFNDIFNSSTEQKGDRGLNSHCVATALHFLSRISEEIGMTKFISAITYIPQDTLMKSKQAKINEQSKTKADVEEEEKDQVTEIKEVQKVESQTLETLLMHIIKWQSENSINFESSVYQNLLILIRKVISSPKIISERQFIVDQVLEMAKIKAEAIESELKQVADGKQNSSQMKKDLTKSVVSKYGELALLDEFAETIIVCTTQISEEINEENLCYLLTVRSSLALQKAAYFMLNHLYTNFIPVVKYKTDIEKEIKELENELGDASNEKQLNELNLKDETVQLLKNIPNVLIEAIQHPPNVEQDETQEQQVEDQFQNNLEALVWGTEREGCLKRQSLAYLLAWNCLLKKIDCGRIKAQLNEKNDYLAVLASLTEFLEHNPFIYQMLLVVIVAYLPPTKRVSDITENDLDSFDPAQIDPTDQLHTKIMSLHTLVAFMKSFPSLARKYYQDCDKKLYEFVLPYLNQVVAPVIFANEIKKIEISQVFLNQSESGTDGLSFSLFKSSREIVAKYNKGEVSMQLKLIIPQDYPIKTIQVEIGQQVKITERQKNKWILAIRNLLQIRNGDIISAVLLWRSNIDKELEGTEECYICYCVLHPTDKSLPRMSCKNCKYNFHVACIRKWFKTSNKSNCPLCQAHFF